MFNLKLPLTLPPLSPYGVPGYTVPADADYCWSGAYFDYCRSAVGLMTDAGNILDEKDPQERAKIRLPQLFSHPQRLTNLRIDPELREVLNQRSYLYWVALIFRESRSPSVDLTKNLKTRIARMDYAIARLFDHIDDLNDLDWLAMKKGELKRKIGSNYQ